MMLYHIPLSTGFARTRGLVGAKCAVYGSMPAYGTPTAASGTTADKLKRQIVASQ